MIKSRSSSNATGIVAYQDASNNLLYLHDVVGTFLTTDILTVKGQGTIQMQMIQ